MELSLKEDSEKAGALSGSCYCVTIIIYFNVYCEVFTYHNKKVYGNGEGR